MLVSKYYTPLRSKNIFKPNSTEPFKLSRSKLELFSECARCFYVDRRMGVGRPPGFPFNLNSAVDALLKKEFDKYRNLQKPHPLMEKFKVDAVPFRHELIEVWRDSLRAGVQYAVPQTNLVITGGVDDLWVNPKGELIIVDYKATSKSEEVTLDAEWQMGYKRQMEIYQWLFRKNGFAVNDTGYFVYCNGLASESEFNAVLKFDIKVIGYKGSTEWVDAFVHRAYDCLSSREVPQAAQDCDYCRYREAITTVFTRLT